MALTGYEKSLEQYSKNELVEIAKKYIFGFGDHYALQNADDFATGIYRVGFYHGVLAYDVGLFMEWQYYFRNECFCISSLFFDLLFSIFTSIGLLRTNFQTV